MTRRALAVVVCFFSTAVAFAGWTQMSGNLAEVSVGSASQMWGVQANQQIWQWNGSGWTQIPGALVDVSVGSDGTVWGVNANGQIYRRDGNSWTVIPGGLVQISVGSATNVWGVNANDQIYRWNGSGWDQIAGGLMYVSAAADGSVWGVSRAGNIYRRDGGSWTQIDGGLMNVAVGSATNVWGVNSSGQVYQRTGTSWTPMPGPMKQVAVGADGTVLGVNSLTQLFRWTPDATPAAPAAASPSATGNKLMLTGQILRSSTGDYLTNNGFVLVMQSDGDLCEYFGTSPTNHQPNAIWCSKTAGAGGKFSAQLHSTNNFCVTTGDEWGQGPALWCTNQVGSGSGPAFAMLNGDGNFFVQQGTPSAPGALLWQSGNVFSQVAVTPPAGGSIQWPDGSACPGTCTEILRVGSNINLRAVPATNYAFAAWKGSCSGASNPCALTVAAGGAQTAGASFAAMYTLTVTPVQGGTVVGAVGGSPFINCGGAQSVCSFTGLAGTRIDLSSKGDLGYLPAGYNGDCDPPSADAQCSVTLNASKRVAPRFSNVGFSTVTLQRTGTIVGGISVTTCTGECDVPFVCQYIWNVDPTPSRNFVKTCTLRVTNGTWFATEPKYACIRAHVLGGAEYPTTSPVNVCAIRPGSGDPLKCAFIVNGDTTLTQKFYGDCEGGVDPSNCMLGQHLVNGQCVNIMPPQTCPPGTQWNGSVCACPPLSQLLLSPAGGVVCVCNAPLHMSGGVCVP